jgi:hypothetical protein
MDDQTHTLGQTDEDILTYAVSDEALEAAAGMERGAKITFPFSMCHGTSPYTCCG